MSDSNNFQEIKRLLKLKQHEVPPPGFFNNFSGDVISRIQAGDADQVGSFSERFQGSWVMGLLQIFQAKPGVIGGFATSLCLLLLIGVVMVDRQDGMSSVGDVASTEPASANMGASAALLPAGDSGITINTNGIHGFQAAPALFGSQQQNPLFQPVAFAAPAQ